MTHRSSIYILAVAAITLLAAPACYTLFKHPKVRMVMYEDESGNRCPACHADDELWSFHHPANDPDTYADRDGGWTSYYQVPWWYESYWYYIPQDPRSLPLLAPPPGMNNQTFEAFGGTLQGQPQKRTRDNSTRVKTTKSVEESDSDDDTSKNRSVRPRNTKEKKKAKKKKD